MNEVKGRGGFTIVELMAVVSIVSILAVVALTAYQDYAVRAKVAEGLGFAAEARTSVSEYYYTFREFPVNNLQTGLPPASAYSRFNHLQRLEIRSGADAGTIEIEYDIPGLGTDNLLHLIPNSADPVVSWTCIPPDTDGIDRDRVPPNCRG